MATKAVPLTGFTELIAHWEQVCAKLLALAKEIPSNKFDHKPAEEVRTTAEILRHVAFWNHYVTDSALGKKADDSANELSRDEFSTRTQILEALSKSASEATAALKKAAGNATPEMLNMLVSFLEHNCEHYGQLVVYARLNGIVPPASRG